MRVLSAIAFLAAVAAPLQAQRNHALGCDGTYQDTTLSAAVRVYRNCEVDDTARVRREPRLVVTPPSSQSVRIGCFYATLEFVVDTTGLVEMGTIVVMRDDMREFTDAVRQSTPQMRFEPARKGGTPVRQLVRWHRGMAIAAQSTPQQFGRNIAPRCNER